MTPAETHANAERDVEGADGDVVRVAVARANLETPPRLRCRVRENQRGMAYGDSRLQCPGAQLVCVFVTGCVDVSMETLWQHSSAVFCVQG